MFVNVVGDALGTKSLLYVPLLVLLSLLAALGPSVPGAHAVDQTGPTLWSPFGPYVGRTVITVYDFPAMFDAFVRGEVDLTDWPVEPSDEAAFSANPDMFLTQGQDEFGIFELDINHHAPFLGVAMQENRPADGFNSPSTKQPTTAGIHIRRALAHMLDKPDFIQGFQLQGRASFVDIQAPPAQGLTIGGAYPSYLPSSVLAEDCQEHPWFTPCDASNPPVSAYNLVADSLPDPFSSFANRGWSGLADLRATCDHFVLAGISVTPSGASCADVAAGTAKLVSGGQTVTFYIRTHTPRKAFGQIFLDGMNYLFDQTVAVNACRFFCDVSGTIFGTSEKDDWNVYTGGWGLGSFPDHLYALYHSSFASDACGGKRSSSAQNYVFYCSPEFDQEATAGEFAATLADMSTHFSNAALIAHRDLMTIPVYSGAGIEFVALNGWNGLVSQIGQGFQKGFWSTLNMRCRPGFASADPRYMPGGGDCTTIRRGFSQEVHKLSPFQATTIWDFEVLANIYDSMLKVNPLTGGVGSQIIDWMTVKHTSTYDAASQTTTQTWTLRNDLKWHDGVALTAEDVAYSIIAFRDIPSGPLLPTPTVIINATAIDGRTVRVNLVQQSPFYELNVGRLPILPKHKWAPICGDPPSFSSPCGDPSFDPMTAGIMVGSGPYMCLHVQTGTVGGTCTETASGNPGTQDVSLGGRIILTAYDGYMRGRPGVADTPLHRFSWSDVDNDGGVNILDIAAAALRFGLPDAYWNSGQNPMAPNVGTDASRVDIGELATVAFYFDHSLTRPFALSALTGLDPDIDPFY